MTKKLKLSDFEEEHYWVFTCPYCDNPSDTFDNPAHFDIYCDHCGMDIEVE